MREQLTESDIKKIQEEIDYRKLVVRKDAIEAVKEARAQGDLSENFEYYAAKRDKNKVPPGDLYPRKFPERPDQYGIAHREGYTGPQRGGPGLHKGERFLRILRGDQKNYQDLG